MTTYKLIIGQTGNQKSLRAVLFCIYPIMIEVEHIFLFSSA